MNSDRQGAALKSFIQGTLGCGCPDEVFEKIEIGSHRIDRYAHAFTRIVVGNTLLIYLVRADAAKPVNEQIKAIGAEGKFDRDSHHYNRFRLVISTLEVDAQEKSISSQFARHFGNDEKMHSHVIHQQLLEGLGI